MAPKDGWRRVRRDDIPKGAVFHRVPRYRPPRPGWGHEHCTLCREKIGAAGRRVPLALPGVLAGLPEGIWMDIGGR